jgi:hypothetical protein
MRAARKVNRALRAGFPFRNRRLSRWQLNLDAAIGRRREEASMSWGVTAPDAATSFASRPASRKNWSSPAGAEDENLSGRSADVADMMWGTPA